MADAAEVIAEWEKENPDPAEVPAPKPESSPELPPESPQEPPAATVRFSLDDVLPDDERLPKSMRGKRVSDLVEYNREKDIAAQKASFEKNAALEKAEAFKSALEVLTREVAGVPRGTQPTPKKVRGSERMRERGVDPKTVYSDADTAFDAVSDAATAAARESIVPEVETQLREVRQQVSTLQQQALNERVRGAFLAARPASVTLEDWESDAKVIGAYVVGQNKNIEDAASYREAGSWLEEARSKRAKPQATAPPAPVAPAPPVGNGQPAPPLRKSTPKVSSHVMGAFNEVTSVLNDVLKGVGGDGKLTTDDILEGMRENPKYKEMFG